HQRGSEFHGRRALAIDAQECHIAGLRVDLLYDLGWIRILSQLKCHIEPLCKRSRNFDRDSAQLVAGGGFPNHEAWKQCDSQPSAAGDVLGACIGGFAEVAGWWMLGHGHTPVLCADRVPETTTIPRFAIRPAIQTGSASSRILLRSPWRGLCLLVVNMST